MMRPRFTEAGQALQLRALAGTQITFTKMQLGDGALGETNYKTLTALISPKATLSLSGIRIADGSATVRGEFNNANMVEGFYYRELGLFAQDPDNAEQEILYCYANFGDECQYIAEPSSAMISRTVRIVATVDDAPNVTAILNDNAQYVDRTELMEILEQHNISETAHRNLMDFEVTYYVDSTTQEDADDRDGSEDHPFMTIQEAADAIPLSALRVMIYLKTGGATYVGLDDDYTFTDYQRIEVLYEGSVETRPIIAGHLRFNRCENVAVQKISFTAAAATEIESPVYLDFARCSHVWVSNVRGYLLSDEINSKFINAYYSTVNVSTIEVISAQTALSATGAGSLVTLSWSNIDGGRVGVFSMIGAMVIVYESTNTASTDYWPAFGGFIYDEDTIEDLSRGAVHAHLQNESNPHKVSLTQAQAKGGTVDVAHGGTGNTTFDSGALLKGNGAGDLAQLLGTGALYAAVSGSPQFGTLPVSAGGTGRTDNGTYVQSSTTNGVLHGSVIIPGTPIMIMWGKMNTPGNTTYSHDFYPYNGTKKFANTNYVLTFSGQDDVWGSVTKNTTGFSIAVGGVAAGSYVADWIAIGIVDEE